jgi:hypothetical protein
MDRLRNYWTETSKDGLPPLRTCRTYDDDEAFTKIALSLLSRKTGMGLSAPDAIAATFQRSQDRASFYESLQLRMAKQYNDSLPSCTLDLVESIAQIFGSELKQMAETELATSFKPYTPRNFSEDQRKKDKARRFCFDDGFFRSRKIQNLDFRLVETISQVQSLRLDGMETLPSYEPPAM